MYWTIFKRFQLSGSAESGCDEINYLLCNPGRWPKTGSHFYWKENLLQHRILWLKPLISRVNLRTISFSHHWKILSSHLITLYVAFEMYSCGYLFSSRPTAEGPVKCWSYAIQIHIGVKLLSLQCFPYVFREFGRISFWYLHTI